MNMRLIKSQILPSTPLDVFHDGSALFAATPIQHGVHLFAIDPESMKFVLQIPLSPAPISNTFRATSDRIFYIGSTGLVGIDSFSGDIAVMVDVGSSIPILFEIKDDLIYSLCAIPLLNKHRYGFESFCICVNDSGTGRKIFQTQTMQGPYSSMLVEESIWACVGSTIYQFGMDGTLESTAPLSMPVSFPLVLTNSFIVASSDLGCLEVFNRKSLISQSKLIAAKTAAGPVPTGTDQIAWACNNMFFDIDFVSGLHRFRTMDRGPVTTPCIKGRDVISPDDSGQIVKVNLDGLEVEKLNLHNDSISKPILFEDSLFLAAKNHLYKLEV